MPDSLPPGKQVYSSFLKDRGRYVDTTESDIGIYPVLEALLIDGIIGSKKPNNMIIVPQLSIAPPPKGSSVDFSISIEKEAVSIV